MAARVIRAEDKRARNKIQTGSDQRNETSLPSVTFWPDEKRETPSVSKLPLPSRNYESPALCPRPDDTLGYSKVVQEFVGKKSRNTIFLEWKYVRSSIDKVHVLYVRSERCLVTCLQVSTLLFAFTFYSLIFTSYFIESFTIYCEV